MKNIEKILPIAIEAIENFILNKDNNTVPEKYKGYIASFGASIVQAGVKPAIAFYSQASKSAGDRTFLIPALIYTLHNVNFFSEDDGRVIQTKLESVISAEKKHTQLNESMFDFVKILFSCIDNNHQYSKKKILEAATGLKLALRLFETSENK